MIDRHLNYIQEQMFNARVIPQDLLKDILTKIYPANYDGRKFSVRNIQASHESLWDWLYSTQNEDPEERKPTDDSKLFITKNNMMGIHTYVNGDIAVFCPRTKLITDFSHNTNCLVIFAPPEVKGQFWKPYHYQDWIEDVTSWRHIDSFFRNDARKHKPKDDNKARMVLKQLRKKLSPKK